MFQFFTVVIHHFSPPFGRIFLGRFSVRIVHQANPSKSFGIFAIFKNLPVLFVKFHLDSKTYRDGHSQPGWTPSLLTGRNQRGDATMNVVASHQPDDTLDYTLRILGPQMSVFFWRIPENKQPYISLCTQVQEWPTEDLFVQKTLLFFCCPKQFPRKHGFHRFPVVAPNNFHLPPPPHPFEIP